ncbi:drug/metabolite transporter integral membrane protein [Neokomagataea thailandica NBRC 106555]|uniref:DMT family transporter n=2 Tax=Neokomagataea TaxID=1223423 RepID=A0A4Y6V605_9PROT|nr:MULTISPECIES: DMT family transporter [Neokomagataea]QDH25489.1 DMT family transporter [Neokomagataea tanensis]GBR52230.1 drug/metabolite transporter integral membrane protein [Neokomagataea thailandica NBRC 106555]
MKHNLQRGALFLTIATCVLALLNALQKKLGGQLTALEIVFFRNLFSLPFVLFVARRTGGTLRTQHFGRHVARSGFGLLSMVMIVYTVTHLPLAEQQALSYTQPLFLVLLSIPLLGERPSIHRWVAVGIGFTGVLVVAAGKGLFQTTDGMQFAALIALAQGAVGALTTMQIRQLSATEASTTITLWQAILMTLATAIPLPFIWVTPSASAWLPLIFIGVFAGLSQILQTEAFASAEVSAIGPFTYTGLFWAALIGWFAFEEPPGIATIVGGALIVSAGIWMLRHDRHPTPAEVLPSLSQTNGQPE